MEKHVTRLALLRGKEAFFLREESQGGSRGQYMKSGGCCNLMSFVFLVE